MIAGCDLGAGVPDREVPEAEAGDREAVEEAGEEEGGSRRDHHTRPQQEEETGTGRGVIFRLLSLSIFVQGSSNFFLVQFKKYSSFFLILSTVQVQVKNI